MAVLFKLVIFTGLLPVLINGCTYPSDFNLPLLKFELVTTIDDYSDFIGFDFLAAIADLNLLGSFIAWAL